ncbi:hypothetical protein IM511_08695 [Erythrobacteraceae bacterium E2-1 Yellow Sea]|nr:hypothetical protein [Erythrobacteraceae bacterium E2-1 Yellow Sea]
MIGRKHAFVLVLLMALAAGLAALLLPPLRDAGKVVRHDANGMAAARALFDAALADPQSQDLGGLAAPAGFAALPQKDEWQGVLLQEPADICVGRGAYLLRAGDALMPLAITAPHRGADRHTGTLAAQFFLEGNVVAAGWNSAPRHDHDLCGNAIDLARQDQHPFTGFALSFAARYPAGRVVQLHGFDGGSRAHVVAGDAAAIISNGTNDPSEAVLDLADCLTTLFAPRPALLYPYETQELGGTQNAQGRAMRAAGFAGFVHIELAADIRARLVQDAELRARFGQCLAGGLQ